MERLLCIHGHFYQPPRENPWLEAVEIQDTAHPYHDWNERITAECYSTNGSSRILDDKNRILDIVSNYAKMSFNIGPTLLGWLKKNARYTYQLILEADKLSKTWRSGHGAALAQAYNHIIMPLANSRDKKTQVVWGIRDFVHRFNRPPEGMWLPETAVDTETLDIMAAEGIKFTILAPHQAKRVRRIGSRNWTDVPNGSIDPSRAYLCNLPSGRSITLLFYDSPISHAVAFERLLDSGVDFARRLLDGFSEKRDNRHQLVHIATDGESYGHHHKFGDMALAYALHYIEKNGLARLTNYGEFLDRYPARHELEIAERTSWSCAHGVERWRSDCGCSTGGNPGWNQNWRAPLRTALDWLGEQMTADYEKVASRFFSDPWAARNDYIDVIMDRSEGNVNVFFSKHAPRHLEPVERTTALKMLEMQRHAMLMFTSCGWFFDDISGIETLQILEYAARAIQLSSEVFGRSLEEGFLSRLKAARSNSPGEGTGADIYIRHVKPYVVNLQKVAAHFAISSLYEEYPEETSIYCYKVSVEDYRKSQSANTVLVTGKCRVTSEITGDTEKVHYSVLYLGGHDFNCGVRLHEDEKSYGRMVEKISDFFEGGNFADIIRYIDQYFGENRYSLKDLFRDEQRNVLETIIMETMTGFEMSYRSMYEDNRILMSFLHEAGIPVIKAFLTAADFTLNLDLKRQMGSDVNPARIGEIMDELKKWSISIDPVDLEFTLRHTLIRQISELQNNPSDLSLLEALRDSIEIALTLPFQLNLWPLQNSYYILAKTKYPEIAASAAQDEKSGRWVKIFRAVGEKLNFNTTAMLKAP